MEKKTNKENLCSNGDLKSGNKYTKYIKIIQNSNNINVRRNFGSNDSQAAAAPRKIAITNKFSSKSKEKTGGYALRKGCKVGIPCSNYHQSKSTINNFTNLAKFNPAVPSGSENVSMTCEGSFAQPSIKNFPLRDITKQVHLSEGINEELINEYNYDRVRTSSTESDQKEEFAQFVRAQMEGRAA